MGSNDDDVADRISEPLTVVDRRRFLWLTAASGASVLGASLLSGCESVTGLLSNSGSSTGRAPGFSLAGYNAASPHWSHMRFRHTSFGGTPSSSDLDWLAAHYDSIMSDSRTPYTSRNATIIHGPYALHWAPIIPSQGTPGIQTVFSDDAASWATAHGKNVEDIFCHYKAGQAKLGGGTGDGTKTLANRLQIFVYSTTRYVVNPGNADERLYQADRINRCFAIFGDEYVFLDEHGTGDLSAARTVCLEYATNTAYQADIIAQLQALRAGLSPASRYFVINTANYTFANDEAMVNAAGGSHMENAAWCGSGLTTNSWTMIDHLSAANVIEVIGALSYNSSNQLSGYPASMTAGNYSSPGVRAKVGEYLMALMAVPASPAKYYFDGASTQWTLSPQSARWLPIYEYVIGSPDAARVRVTGLPNDPAGQVPAVYYRLFNGGVHCVVLRINSSTPGSQYGDNSAVTVTPPPPGVGTSWRRIKEDGTVDTTNISAVSLRLWEGVILVAASAQGVVSDTFTRANSSTSLGTPEVGPTGAAWVIGGSPIWGVNSNQAYLSSSRA
jgi:hypothetical protein